MFVFEAEVLQLGLDGEEAQAVSQRGVDVEGLAGDFVLFVGSHRAQGAHVVQAVGHLDEDDADVLAHRQQQLAEVLGLCRGAVAEDAAGDFGQSPDNLGHLVAEVGAYVLDGVLGVLDDVVKEGGAYRRGAKANLLARYFGYRYGVQYVRLARAAAHTGMGVFGEAVGPLDNLHFLAVVAGQIAVEHIAEGVVHHPVFLGSGKIGFVVHKR